LSARPDDTHTAFVERLDLHRRLMGQILDLAIKLAVPLV
jgi:hypothetical protein